LRKLVIVATKYNQTPEAQEVFNQRNWHPIQDQSTFSGRRRLIEEDGLSTPLIGLRWRWEEYDE